MNKTFDSNENYLHPEKQCDNGLHIAYLVQTTCDTMLKDINDVAVGWSTETSENYLIIEVQFFNPDKTEGNYFSATYALDDMNAVSDLARFIDRLTIMRYIKGHETEIAQRCGLVNPDYATPTFRNKGKVVFTDSTTGTRVKFTFTRADFDKLLNLAPPPQKQ